MYKNISTLALLGIVIVFAGGLVIAPHSVSADAANPSLMELIGKNPDAECVPSNTGPYPYGNNGYIDCETTPSNPTCPETQSKYFKFLGSRANVYYFCPLVQYEAAKCEQGEEMVTCGSYYPDTMVADDIPGLDVGAAGIRCGNYGKFPYTTSTARSFSPGFEQFKKESRFLIANYGKFNTTEKYCRKIAPPAQAVSQEKSSEQPLATSTTPINDRSMILLGALIAGIAVIAGIIIIKIRHSA